MSEPRLFFRQLLAGRDFARSDPIAAQMRNFVYLIGDRERGECVLVDPAWNVGELLDLAAADDMRVTGVLATHYHPDHVGGDLLGMAQVEGIRELLAREDVPVFCHERETEWIEKATGVTRDALEPLADAVELRVGEVPIRILHTPGHTPGSQCFLVGKRLVAGDTLFLQGCGRTDLPGGDPEEMYRTLHEKLALLPDDLLLYPGHHYGPAPSAPLGEVKRTNYVFRMRGLDDWLRFL